MHGGRGVIRRGNLLGRYLTRLQLGSWRDLKECQLLRREFVEPFGIVVAGVNVLIDPPVVDVDWLRPNKWVTVIGLGLSLTEELHHLCDDSLPLPVLVYTIGVRGALPHFL